MALKTKKAETETLEIYRVALENAEKHGIIINA